MKMPSLPAWLPLAVPIPGPVKGFAQLGQLSPQTRVNFNTTDDTYRVYGGPLRLGGWLNGAPQPPDGPGPTIRLFDFTTIEIAPGVKIVASGDYALGSLAAGDIRIDADLLLTGRDGGVGGAGGGSGSAAVPSNMKVKGAR